jgi:hypothetical protein
VKLGLLRPDLRGACSAALILQPPLSSLCGDGAAVIRPAFSIDMIPRRSRLAAICELDRRTGFGGQPIARPLLYEGAQVKRAEPNHSRRERH